MEHPDGLVKIAEGREAEMFALDDDKVLRLYRPDTPRERVEKNVAIARAIEGTGVRVPHSYEIREVGGRLGVVMERIPGKDLLEFMAKKPWRVWWVGKISGEVHAKLGETIAPTDLETLHERMRRFAAHAPEIPDAYRAIVLRALETLPEGDRLCHGDMHPANLMMKDGEPVVIDWSNASRGVPEADYVRSLLTIEIGEPPPGTSRIILIMARFARSILRNAYKRAYGKSRRVDEQAVLAWRLPVTIMRLVDAIPGERKKLVRRIDKLIAEGDTPPA
jgi:RIO-like serine/threonine protein kinase